MTTTRNTPLARAASVLLALLIVLPFTAPFSSCPLSLLYSSGHTAPLLPGIKASAHEVPPADCQSVLIEEQLQEDAAVLGDQICLAVRARLEHHALVVTPAIAPTHRPLVLRL